MRRLILALITCAVVGSLVVARADERSEKLDRQAAELYQQVFSPFCPGRSLNDCPSSKAHDLKVEMRQKLETGVPPQTILEDVFKTFGDQYRAIPTYSGFGRLVWWAPVGFLLIGLGVAGGVALGRKKSESAPARVQKNVLTDEMKAQIERELSSID